jgi:hypothetical protein
MKTKLAILLICVMMLIPGCMVIWTDQAFVATIFKTVDANDIELIAEPNYIQIGSGQTKTKNDKIKASGIIGGMPVRVESGE